RQRLQLMYRSGLTAVPALSLHDALPILLTHWPAYTTSDLNTSLWSSESPSSTINSSADGRPIVRAKLAVGLSAASCGSFPRSSRSEEHTSELQSRENLVCRLLLEKKKFI